VKILVDTSVWSQALRRDAPPSTAVVGELRALIEEGRVAIIGPIRQELLSGIRNTTAFERVRDHLRSFEDEALTGEDFERAAEHFNAYRAKGIQGSNTDFLICAAAERRGFPIFTTDVDFIRFARLLPIELHGR
jgi:hypothetical protein